MATRLLIAMIALGSAVSAQAADIRFTVTEVKDTRSTGQFFNGLDIKLKVTGDDAIGTQGIRTIVTRAVDDTGRSLLKEEEKNPDFKPVPEGELGAAVELKFKNPTRKATVVKEIAGEVHLFMPESDPTGTILIKDLKKQVGKPINQAALAKAGVRVTVLTKKEYEALVKEKEKEAEQEAEKNLGQEMVNALKGMFSSFFRIGEHDVILDLTDPEQKIIRVDVVDGKGALVPTTSVTTSKNLKVLGFDQAIPPDAQLRVVLKTANSVVVVPLKVVDVALP